MRFRRADLPGMLIATLGPAGLVLLVLAVYGLWDHHGSPLLPTIAVHLAIGAGLLAAFTRYVRHWGLTGTLIGALLVVAAASLTLYLAGQGATPIDRALRVLGVVLFVVVNLVILREILWYGIAPLLDRRDARKAAEREARQT